MAIAHYRQQAERDGDKPVYIARPIPLAVIFTGVICLMVGRYWGWNQRGLEQCRDAIITTSVLSSTCPFVEQVIDTSGYQAVCRCPHK